MQYGTCDALKGNNSTFQTHYDVHTNHTKPT